MQVWDTLSQSDDIDMMRSAPDGTLIPTYGG